MKQREIKFRGMDIMGRWFIGLLSISQGKSGQPPAGYYISNSAGQPWAYHVRPETVGQYIGLKDKNGVEVYEGDFVVVDGMFDSETGQTENEIRVVQYIGPSVAVVEYIVNEGESKADVLFVHDIIGGGVEQDDVMEVIGNVYENPELLTP